MEEHYACLATLDCAEFLAAFGDGDSSDESGSSSGGDAPSACATEATKVDSACAFGDS